MEFTNEVCLELVKHVLDWTVPDGIEMSVGVQVNPNVVRVVMSKCCITQVGTIQELRTLTREAVFASLQSQAENVERGYLVNHPERLAGRVGAMHAAFPQSGPVEMRH